MSAVRSLAQFNYEIGALMGRGDLDGAARTAAACREAWPADGTGWLLGSIAALLADDKRTALELVEGRLATHPTDVQCLIQKAECLLALGERDSALAAADAATSAADSTASLDATGEFWVHAAEHSRALRVYDRALALAPRDRSLLAKRAALHRFLGNFELAGADHEAILAISPADAEALKGLAELRLQTRGDPSLVRMQEALAALTPDSPESIPLHFALAKSHEDLGDYKQSWRHLSAGNRLQRLRTHYEPELDRAVFERLQSGFSATEPRSPDTTGERPIFILGLPRTGSTLVERIIGTHSMVHSGGELLALSESIGAAASRRSTPRPASWLEYTDGLPSLEGEAIAREYVQRTRARRGDRPRFSDKQPANFYYCPLIFRAFPEARIVHLTRHPLAACYAIYKTLFRGTFPFAYDLTELDYYVGYSRLMAHWHRILPGRILDVAYEDVVTAQEATTRRMLEYLGLPFEAACLDFHLNPDATMTGSSVQVRQPLYDSSLAQWQHYAAELAPLRERLMAAGLLREDSSESA